MLQNVVPSQSACSGFRNANAFSAVVNIFFPAIIIYFDYKLLLVIFEFRKLEMK